MAQVPYDQGIQNVLPQTQAPQDYQHEAATPEEAGGLIAQGEQKLGAGTSTAGKFFGEVAASNTSYDYMKSANDIVTNFEGLTDDAAMKAAPQVRQQLDDLFKKSSSSLQTPDQQFYFNEYSRRFNTILDERVGGHVARQTDSWYTQVENKGIDQGISQVAGADPNSPTYDKQVGLATGMAMQSAVRQFQRQTGWVQGQPLTPDESAVLDDKLGKVRQAAVKSQVEALLPVDPMRAKAALEDPTNRQVIGQFYEPLSAQIKDKATKQTALGVVGDASNSAGVSFTAPAGSDALHSIFMQQESSNQGPNPGQIQPDTFRLFAKPGETYGDPNADRAVAYRAIDSYAQRYQGDPQRIAVAYFSGPGNVSPPGSPNPWVRDAADKNGKTVSSYVADISQRATPEQFKASAYQRILDDPRSQDPDVLRQALGEFNTRFTASEYAAEADAKAKRDASQQAATSYIQLAAKGGSPTMLQDIANDPRLDYETKAILPEVINRYAASGDDAKRLGSGYSDALRRVALPDSDPNRLSDARQVIKLGLPDESGNAPLTMAGIDQIQGQITRANKDPAGNAALQIYHSTLDYAKRHLTFAMAAPGFAGLKDPKGMDIFDLQFTPAFTKYWEDGIASGKSPAELADRKSIDGMIDSMRRSDAEYMKDYVTEGVVGSDDPVALQKALAQHPGAPGQPAARNLGAIISDVRGGKLTDAQGRAEAMKLGFIRPDAPPTPEPSAPLAGFPVDHSYAAPP